MEDEVVVEDAQFHASVTPHPLQLNRYTDWVADPGAGAIASFTGVTRDNFEGQRTARLEYEAYTPMAVAKLRDLCAGAAARWQIIRMAVAHRIGEVGVGQPSVIIAVSSAHRREALEACHWAIDELKATVPIWKKEYFEGGEVWKENAESRARLLQQREAAEAIPRQARVTDR